MIYHRNPNPMLQSKISIYLSKRFSFVLYLSERAPINQKHRRLDEIAMPPSTSTSLPVSTPDAANSNTTPAPKTPIFAFIIPNITTTFTPPPSCTNGSLTMLERQSDYMWQNEPLPVPGSTFSDCFPSQFIDSYLNSASNVIYPPFSPLVCPQNYATVSSELMPGLPLYIVCCPRCVAP